MSEMNGGVYRNDLETRSLGSPYRRSQSIHDVYRRPIPVQSETGSETYSKYKPTFSHISYLSYCTTSTTVIQIVLHSESKFITTEKYFYKITEHSQRVSSSNAHSFGTGSETYSKKQPFTSLFLSYKSLQYI